jgi:hypothetical protein
MVGFTMLLPFPITLITTVQVPAPVIVPPVNTLPVPGLRMLNDEQPPILEVPAYKGVVLLELLHSIR